MSQYRKLSHATYLCEYHVVFCPKYRKRVLRGRMGHLARDFMRQVCEWKAVEIEEGHVAHDHVLVLLVSIPPKFAVSNVIGLIKGRTTIRLFKHVPKLWGGYRRSFWARGYFVSTVGVNEAIIWRYVEHQEMKERQAEQLGLDL